jgi:hypothetical protein
MAKYNISRLPDGKYKVVREKAPTPLSMSRTELIAHLNDVPSIPSPLEVLRVLDRGESAVVEMDD